MSKIKKLKIKVYVAGPMGRGNVGQNISTGVRVCNCIAEQGFAVFNPFLTHFWDLLYPHDSVFYMEQDFAWLRSCDLFVRILSGIASEGADREEKLARRLGIPVLYWSAEWKHMQLVHNSKGEWELL